MKFNLSILSALLTFSLAASTLGSHAHAGEGPISSNGSPPARPMLRCSLEINVPSSLELTSSARGKAQLILVISFSPLKGRVATVNIVQDQQLLSTHNEVVKTGSENGDLVYNGKKLNIIATEEKDMAILSYPELLDESALMECDAR